MFRIKKRKQYKIKIAFLLFFLLSKIFDLKNTFWLL